jgi:hypothetical protein
MQFFTALYIDVQLCTSINIIFPKIITNLLKCHFLSLVKLNNYQRTAYNYDF